MWKGLQLGAAWLFAASCNAGWPVAIGEEGDEVAWSVAVDSTGGVVATGESREADSSIDRLWLERRAPGGGRAWSHTFEQPRGNAIGWHVAVGEDDSVWVTGNFDGELPLAPEAGAVLISEDNPAVGYPTGDVFLAGLSPDGSILWSSAFGGGGYDIAHAVTVDPSRNVIIGGKFHEAADFGGEPLMSNDGEIPPGLEGGFGDIFIAKYSNVGDHIWSVSAGGLVGESVADLDTYPNADIAAVGSFSRSVDFGDLSLEAAGRDGFAARLSSEGAFLWVVALGGPDLDGATAAATGSDDSLYVTGFFKDTADFNGCALTQAGDTSDAFVVKLSSEGACQWATRVSGPGRDSISAVAFVPAEKAVAIGGRFEGAASVAGEALEATAESVDAFFALLSAEDGRVLSVTTFGGEGSDAAQAVSAGDEALFVGGSFEGKASYEGGSLRSHGGVDAFLLKGL